MDCNCSKKTCNCESPDKHPCFNFDSCKTNARMHLPVAPKCNIQCSYCDRKYDCINESRPGVTSIVLTPEQAAKKYFEAKKKLKNISVVGFAGPGDSLANFDRVEKTIELIREKDKEVLLCLSTNGLLLPEHAEKIIKLGVSHITITINAIDPEIIAKIYDRFFYKGKKLNSIQGAKVLIQNQLEGLRKLSSAGVLCKVNTLYIKGINDFHIPEAVKTVKEYGAFISNITKLIPAKNTKFQDLPPVTDKEIKDIRTECSQYLKQMLHCRQCRADSVGLLTEDRFAEIYL